MELTRNALAFVILAVVATVGGVALVLGGPEPLPIVGVLAIIVGLISLMPGLYFALE